MIGLHRFKSQHTGCGLCVSFKFYSSCALFDLPALGANFCSHQASHSFQHSTGYRKRKFHIDLLTRQTLRPGGYHWRSWFHISTWKPAIMTEVLHVFPQPLQANSGTVDSLNLAKASPFHILSNSLFILSFDALCSDALRASSDKLQINKFVLLVYQNKGIIDKWT
jgi:uncharacterized membrane protein